MGGRRSRNDAPFRKQASLPAVEDYELDLADLIDRAQNGQIEEEDFIEEVVALTVLILLLALRRGSGMSEAEIRAHPELSVILYEAEQQARLSAGNLADDIYRRRMFVANDDSEDTPNLTAQEAMDRRRNRAALWAGTALGIYAIGQLHQRNDPYLEWRVGQTEHCSDCLRLNGQVHRASEWRDSGWAPQSRVLACTGRRCQCSLHETHGPSRGGF